jgi:hypothetical protein
MARINTPTTYACGACGEFGHNKRTCGKPVVAKAPRVARASAAPAMRIDPTLLAALLTGDAAAIQQVAALLAASRAAPAAPAPVAPVAEEVVSPVAEDATEGEGYSDFNYAEGVDAEVAAMTGEEFLKYVSEKYPNDFDLAFGGEDDSEEEEEDDDGMDADIENELDDMEAAG